MVSLWRYFCILFLFMFLVFLFCVVGFVLVGVCVVSEFWLVVCGFVCFVFWLGFEVVGCGLCYYVVWCCWCCILGCCWCRWSGRCG